MKTTDILYLVSEFPPKFVLFAPGMLTPAANLGRDNIFFIESKTRNITRMNT